MSFTQLDFRVSAATRLLPPAPASLVTCSLYCLPELRPSSPWPRSSASKLPASPDPASPLAPWLPSAVAHLTISLVSLVGLVYLVCLVGLTFALCVTGER